MKIALINIPLQNETGKWISVPPEGYGGIQRVVANLVEGFLHLGHKVWLLGTSSTHIFHPNLTVINAVKAEDIVDWLQMQVTACKIDMIHDHSNGIFRRKSFESEVPVVTTHHLTGKPRNIKHCVYLSFSQRSQAECDTSPVIRIPINPFHYRYSQEKDDYLLYLGRVSEWKGVYESAQFANYVGLKLIIAGPAWEEEYLSKVLSSFPKNVEYIGEVGGERRINLLSKAKAILVFSKNVLGPWGDIWCEPGSTVVSEAAVSGTPVISSANGCLREIVPEVGVVVESTESWTSKYCNDILGTLPRPEDIFKNAIRKWNYVKISQKYINFFEQIIGVASAEKKYIPCVDWSIKEQLLMNGGVVVPSVVEPEMIKELDEITMSFIRSWEADKIKDPDFWFYRDDEMQRNVLYRIHNLEKKHSRIAEIIDHLSIKKLREIIFCKPTKASAFALIYKDPNGSGPVPWHRDPIDVPPNTVYNFSIYLDESDLQNGGLQIVEGSHLDKEKPLGENPENGVILSAKPGDIAIHDVCVYHGSTGSLDGRKRRSIVIEFQPIP